MALTRRFVQLGRRGLLVTLKGDDVELLVELSPSKVIAVRKPIADGASAVVAAAFASKLFADIDAGVRARLRGEARALVNQVLA